MPEATLQEKIRVVAEMQSSYGMEQKSRHSKKDLEAMPNLRLYMTLKAKDMKLLNPMQALTARHIKTHTKQTLLSKYM